MLDMACQIQGKQTWLYVPVQLQHIQENASVDPLHCQKNWERGGGGGMVVNLNCNHMKSYVYSVGNRDDLKIYFSPRPLGSNCESKYITDTTQRMKA